MTGTSFLRGIGVGMAVGAAMGYAMHGGKKKRKTTMSKAIKAVGDMAENISDGQCLPRPPAQTALFPAKAQLSQIFPRSGR